MIYLLVQGVVILGYATLFHFIDPYGARVIGRLGILWLAMVISCLCLDFYLKVGICVWDWRWRRLQQKVQRALPEGITVEEIDAGIERAIQEARAERIASGRRAGERKR